MLAEAGQLREPAEFRGVAPFLLLPFAGEEAPLPEERFVADVEIALGGKRRGREEKVSVVLLEDADDLLDLGYAGTGDGLDLGYLGAAAGDLPVGRDVAEQQKETPRDVSLFRIVLDFVPSGVGVEREGHFDSACGLVVFGHHRDGAVRACARDGVFPRAHERVLHERELVGAVAGIVDDAVHQPLLEGEGLECPFLHGSGPRDRLLHLPAIKPRDEELTVADLLGQAQERLAIADKIRAHRQDRPDTARRLGGGADQHAHKGGRFIARSDGVAIYAGPAKGEEFLELVHYDHDPAFG